VNAAVSIAGVPAARDLAPVDRRQLAGMMRELYETGRSFTFVGGGTDLDFGNPPRSLDAVIRTAALSRILDYAPEDQTITVEAGARIAEIDAALAEHAQILPVDVGDRKRATIGGAIATNAFGARRHRYGSIKDLIVGIEMVRPDGVIARGGGKVVKNVAGFDLPKLLVGSLGTLGAIVSATLRVHPAPQTTRAIELGGENEQSALDAVLADRSLDPAAVVSTPQRGIVLTFAGLAHAVEAQLTRVEEIATLHHVDARLLDDAERENVQARERDVRVRGSWRATIGYAPAGAPPACVPSSARVVTYPTIGVTVAASDDEAFDRDAVARARERGTVVFHALPARARATFDAWGDAPPSFPLMRALKTQFDPKGLCTPGRFVGGL
jgi:glycolate oxidase FAD binding subunit